MRQLFYIFLFVSMVVGIYRTVRYFVDDDYNEETTIRSEEAFSNTTSTFSTIFQYSLYGLAAAGSLAILMALIFTRWRPIRVFISYNFENEDFAKEIQEAIDGFPIKAYYLPYSDMEHNEVIQKISKMMKKSDAVVTIPGNRSESNFTDAEIMTASTLGKPIVILMLDEEQRLPNTAYTGYPHLRYSMDLINQINNPLRYFLTVTFRHFKSIWAIMRRGFLMLRNVLIGCAVIAFLLSILMSVLKVFNPLLPIMIMPYVLGIILAIALIGVFVFLIQMIIEQYRLARIARQNQISGDLTYDQLHAIFKNDQVGGSLVLNSLVKGYLQRRDS
ncbi:MAG: TIR domain-containing protein [Cyclobacteriaceae bacterium]